MSQQKNRPDPVQQLRQLAATEASRRAEAKERNRARWPWLAELADVTGGKVIWAQDADGEIGKRPKLEPGCFEVSAETLVALAEHEAVRRKRK